jgi:alpha-glucosidase
MQRGAGTYELGAFNVEVSVEGGVRVSHDDSPERTLWQSVSGRGFSELWVADDEISELRGALNIEETVQKRCGAQGDVAASREGDVLTLVHTHTGAGCEGFGATLTFQALSHGELGFRLEPLASASQATRTLLVYATEAGESFHGFGEQYTYVDLRGREVPIVIQEQGVGRGNGLVSSVVNLGSEGSAGDWSTTYYATPFYLTNRGRALMLENEEISWFDLTSTSEVKVRLRGREMRGRILFGETPKDVLTVFTSYTGRMPPLPDYLNEGAVVGMQGGTQRVRTVLAQLDAYDTPLAAFWLQDWVGKRQTTLASQLWWNWQLNEEQYPGWDALVDDLGMRGIRMFTYVNPFLVDVSQQSFFTRNLYAEALSRGFLVKDEQGMPYAITNTTFDAGLLDLSNPDALTWFEQIIRDEILGAGASGYMLDYGEALPYDAVLASGESADTFHNRYPEVWQKLHRDVLEADGLMDEVTFFARSGFTKSPGLSTLFWLGDQTVTWDGDDGLASAVKGLLTGGLSGLALNHSDIGGYTGYSFVLRRSEELLLRWIEFGAFTPVYRTHEGTAPDNFVQVYDNATTLGQFAKFAKLFAALAPYRKQLMTEATERGIPLVRHMLLEFPADPIAYKQDLQLMLGPDVLMVPVVESGRTSVRAYVPAGNWVHLWTGRRYTRPGTYDINAPLGQPAVFYREGSSAGDLLKNAL